MTAANEKITRAQKIEALGKSVWAASIVIPVLLVFLLIFYLLRYHIAVRPLAVIFLLAIAGTLLQAYLVKQERFIDQSYDYAFIVFIGILALAGIHYTGSLISPFMWLLVYLILFVTINYSYRKGLQYATIFSVLLGVNTILGIWGIVPHVYIIHGFHPLDEPRFAILMLLGYMLVFFVGPLTIGFLSDQVRREKERAVDMAVEKDKAYRASLSVMEDLEAARGQLESRVKEIDDSRRATLHLLQDVEKSREDAQQKAVEIAKLYDDLKAVDRMKTEFLSMISHELRTPMTPIKGYAELLLSGQVGEMPEPQKRAVSVIKKEGEHLLGLIDSILDVSRLERGIAVELKKEPVSLKVLLDDLQEVMETELTNRGIKLEVGLPPNFPTLIADPSKLHRLLTNLLGNAVKFTPKGGWIKIVGSREDDTARIEVIDNGIGIAKENLDKIFEKFYQVDSSYTRAVGGVGLGLAIARDIVVAHGGKIRAESEGLGKGTRIIFTLPVGGG